MYDGDELYDDEFSDEYRQELGATKIVTSEGSCNCEHNYICVPCQRNM
jgi:hypothetical protein